MRPVKLELQYFGPYEHEVIDFTQFRDQSLFLVAGNTGAGKTTIFDAMCYALFGETSIDERSAAALRSDFAPADKETKVAFIFSHQGTQYQIMRRPKQTLQGRGGKMVDHNQAVSLIYPLESERPHEITKLRDADSFITALLNLTRDQFKQIVLLPQGKFRQFLDSDSNKKQELLKDLFNTRLYDRWTNELKTRLSVQKKDLAAQETKLQSFKENISEIDPQLPAADWLAAVDQLLAKTKNQLNELTASADHQQTVVTTLTNQLHAEQDLQSHLTELAATKKVAAALASRREEMTAVEQELADLQWFRSHQTDYQRWQDGERQLTSLAQEITELTTKQEKLTGQLATVSTRVEELTQKQPAIATLKEKATSLKEKLPLFTTVTSLKRSVSKLNKKSTAITADQQEKQEQLDQLTAQLADLATKIKSSGDLTDEKLKLNKQELAQQQLEEKAADYHKLTSELAAEKATVDKLQETVRQQQAAVDEQQEKTTDLNDAYARHQIAVLAAKLKPGSPCPVCGALDHPQPAQAEEEGELVTDAQLKAATAALQRCQEKFNRSQEQLLQAQKQVAKQAEQVQSLGQVIAGLLSLDQLPVDWQKQVKAQADQLQQAQADLAKREKQLTAWQHQHDEQRAQLTTCQDELATIGEHEQALRQELVKQQAILEEKQASLPHDLTDEAAAKKRLATYDQQVAIFEKDYEVARQERQNITQAMAVAKSQLTKDQADQQELTNQQDQRQAALKDALNDYRPTLTWTFWAQASEKLPRFAELQKVFADYQTSMHDNQQQQQRLTTLIKGRQEPDIPATQAKLAAANEKLTASQQKIGQLNAAYKDVTSSHQRVAKLLEKTGLLNQQLNELQTLTDVVSGNTENSLGLERYVLQSYFQDVLVAANVQLAHLTNGRYQFELSQERHGAGRKWSGLEVNVYDDNAGRTRSARTLSGGESFMASLALALALCQIIQEQSGGVSIDALFIDEGFGSLDQQALADALRALQELEGHRMIGIISHVTELEEQVPDQLLVESHNGRSHVSYRHEL
ncbi:AAA family ATPase [Limosilactobacillus caccae]|uniref:AAA family ATPase n=1 Tax=Limosilactobacillus caccae TaxID=1926284 RepID=UPI00097124F9|nr:SMC family ATPase [Limosilactobacillus caccae]